MQLRVRVVGQALLVAHLLAEATHEVHAAEHVIGEAQRVVVRRRALERRQTDRDVGLGFADHGDFALLPRWQIAGRQG